MRQTLPPLNIDYSTFLREHFVLPPLPTTLIRVLEAVQSTTTSARDVVDLISRDPAMVSHILKVVNSAYYGLPKPIGDLRYAIAYLGLAEVSRIALTLSVIETLKPRSKEELQRFWVHSYFSALIARLLARVLKDVSDDGELYAATLLHDVGELVYQRFFPDHYGEIIKYSLEKETFLVDAEHYFGLPSHLTFGSLLCDHWHLPASVKRACEFHEFEHLKSISDRQKANPFDVLITVANMLASLAHDPLHNKLRQEVTAEIRRVLGLSDEEFLVLMGDVYALKVSIEDTFGQMI